MTGKRPARGAAARPGAADISKGDYEALAAFRHALRHFLRFSEEGARAAGITPQQHALLLAVRGQPGRDWASIGELARSLQIQHHTTVGLTDRCVHAGLVRRETDLDDRRQVRVVLTAKGSRLLARLSARNRQQLRVLRQTLQLPFLDAAEQGPAGRPK